MLSSPQNKRIKELLLLQQKSSHRRQQGMFVVEGRRELRQCLDAGYAVESVYLCPDLLQSGEPVAGLSRCIVTEVSRSVYEKIAYRGSTEGVVAVVRQPGLRLPCLPVRSS